MAISGIDDSPGPPQIYPGTSGSTPGYTPPPAPAPAPAPAPSAPAAPSAPSGPTTIPYNLSTDPAVLLAQSMYNYSTGDLQKQYALKMQALNAPTPYSGDGGVAAANLAYQQAQAQAASQQSQLAHDLPLTILGIVNHLAAHGLGNSGDATFLPGEASYTYNTNLANLAQNLAFKKQSIGIAQQQQAAQQASESAQRAFANQQAAAEANLWLAEQQEASKQDYASAVINAFQNAENNPAYAISGDPSALLKSLGLA